MIGQTLSHYEIQAKLGEGGMGVVYRARDTRLDRAVAIKVLRPEAVGDPERKWRFVREAKAASALNHANIVTIYEIDSANRVDFIAMEYIRRAIARPPHCQAGAFAGGGLKLRGADRWRSRRRPCRRHRPSRC